MRTKSENISPTASIEVRLIGPPVKPEAFSWYGLIPVLLTIIAAIVGYMIVERFARVRERRADLRILLASFRDAVDSVEADVVRFYRLHGASPAGRTLAASIKTKIATLAEILEVMRMGRIDVEGSDELRLFRQAVTGGDFDSWQREPLPEDSPNFVAFSKAAQQLQRRVDLSFYRLFLSRRRSFKWSTRQDGAPLE